MPPVSIDRYAHSALQEQFSNLIESQFGLDEVAVDIRSSRLADLDNDGETDDLYGTAFLQIGRRFKSFIYLLREDGAVRFLEDSGAALNPSSDLRLPHCFESRPWHCRYDFTRAARMLRSPRISMLEYDSARESLELVIHRNSGVLTVINSLEIFATSPR